MIFRNIIVIVKSCEITIKFVFIAGKYAIPTLVMRIKLPINRNIKSVTVFVYIFLRRYYLSYFSIKK